MLADNRRKSMNQISVDLREKMPSIILSKAHKLTANEQQSNPSSIQEKRKNQIFCFREFEMMKIAKKDFVHTNAVPSPSEINTFPPNTFSVDS